MCTSVPDPVLGMGFVKLLMSEMRKGFSLHVACVVTVGPAMIATNQHVRAEPVVNTEPASDQKSPTNVSVRVATWGKLAKRWHVL